MTSQLPQTDISTLENYVNSLTSLLEAISITRHHYLPNLITNLKQPIQNNNSRNKSIPPEAYTQIWKKDSEDLTNAIDLILTQVKNTQQAMQYVTCSSKIDNKVDIEFKNRAFAISTQIIQKVKQQRSISLKSRSSLSKLSKSGISIDPNIIKNELIQWKNLKNLKKQLSNNPFPLSNQISLIKEEVKFNLNEIIVSINKFNQQDNLISLISDNHILLNNVMHVFLIFRPSSKNLVIERTCCFSLNESTKNIYHSSSFSLIRSINRCINQTISQYSPSSDSASSPKEDAQNQSNLILVCSLISSYKDLFKTELTNLRTKTTTSTRGRAYIKRARDPRIVNNDPVEPSNSKTNNNLNKTNNNNNVEKIKNSNFKINKNYNRNRDEFLTWRRWHFEKKYLIEQIKNKNINDQDDQMQIDSLPSNLDDQSDPIHIILSRGKWIPVPEIN